MFRELFRLVLEVKEKKPYKENDDFGVSDFLPLRPEFGEVEAISVMPEFTHAFSHYKLTVAPLRVKMKRVFMMAAQANYQWLPVTKLKQAALPAPIKKLLVDG